MIDTRVTPENSIRDRIHETRLFNRRVVVAVAAVLSLMALVIVRLAYLQIVYHEHYATLSQNNRITLAALPPGRGLIYDRNGVVLAQNLPAYSLEIVPEQVPDLDATLVALQEIVALTDADIERFRKALAQKRSAKGVPLRFRLSEEEVARFAVNRPRFPGVDVAAGLSRHYPLGALGVHAIGYVGRISEEELDDLDTSNYSGTSDIGKTGVEKSYEEILHGRVGFEQVETNAQGRRLRVLKTTPPQAGQNLHLNLDARLQAVAEQALGQNRGAVVALDPRDGSVLALASMPGYDPNPFVNGIDSKSYDALHNSPDHPLYNRALRGAYPPGSTIKPFVGLGGLEMKQISLDQNIFCPGFYTLKGRAHQYRDWKHGGHGTVSLDKAIVESCDVYFYTLAHALGIDRLHDFLTRFGLGVKTGIDVTGELEGLIPSPEWKRRVHNQPWYPGETLIAGIGQGYTLVTPLQLAVATATLANRGKRWLPALVKTSEDSVSHALTPLAGDPLEQVPIVNPAHWQSVIDAMVRVVHSERGTARKIGLDARYTIAGKTGTAQVFGVKQDEKYVQEKVAERLRDHALFIAFAPADDPRIAVAVIVENGSHGSTAAAPVARQVMDRYFLDNPL
jgi:penicillin-binding protein 2